MGFIWTLCALSVIYAIMYPLCVKHYKKVILNLLDENEYNVKYLNKLQKDLDSADDVSQCALTIETMIATCDKNIAINNKLIKLSKWVFNGKKLIEIENDLDIITSSNPITYRIQFDINREG